MPEEKKNQKLVNLMSENQFTNTKKRKKSLVKDETDPVLDNLVVHKEGVETIRGDKVFSDTINLNTATAITKEEDDSTDALATTEFVQRLVKKLQDKIKELTELAQSMAGGGGGMDSKTAAKISNFINYEMDEYLKYTNIYTEKFIVRTKRLSSQSFRNKKSLKRIYITKNCEEIPGITVDESPFIGCSEDLEIYTEISEDLIPNGWKRYWNYRGEGLPIPVFYGTEIEFFYNLGQSNEII